MSSGLMLDDIIMNLFKDSTEKTTDLVRKHLFSKIQDNTIHLYKGYLQDFTRKRTNSDTKKTLRLYHFIEKDKLRKYLSGILSIDNDWADLEKKKISSSMILATLITNISFSATTNLYPIYLKNHVTYNL